MSGLSGMGDDGLAIGQHGVVLDRERVERGVVCEQRDVGRLVEDQQVVASIESASLLRKKIRNKEDEEPQASKKPKIEVPAESSAAGMGNEGQPS